MATESIIFQIDVQDSELLKKTAQYEKQLVSLRKERKELNKEIRDGNGATDEQSKRLAELNIKIQGTSKALRQSRRETVAVAGSLDQQRARLSRLLRQYDSFDKTVDNAADEMAGLKDEINNLTSAIKDQEEGTDRFQRNVGNYKNAVIGAFDSIGINLGQFLSGPLAALGGAQLLKEATQAAIEYAEELRKITTLTQQLTGEVGASLDVIIAKTQTISQVFEKDYQEVLVAANATAKQFGITQAESLDIIQQGFVAGGDASGEFLDILREYSPQLRSIGLDADQSIAIITQQVRSGAFSDKGIDALKEAGERLREMPEATASALDAIGISSSTIQQEISSGSKSLFDIVRQVSGRLGELPPQSREVGRAIEQVFGTPGLDLGLPLLLDLQDINLELDEVVANSGRFAQQQQRLIESQNQLNFAWNDFFNTGNGGFGDLIQNAQIFSNKVLGALLFKINQTTRSISRFFGFVRDQEQGGDGGEAPPNQVREIEKETEEIAKELEEQRKVYEEDLKKRLELLDQQESEARTRAINRATERTQNNEDEKASEKQLQDDLFDIKLDFVQRRLALEEQLKNETFRIREELAGLLRQQAQKEGEDELRERRASIEIETIDTNPDAVNERFGIEQQQLSDHLDRINEITAEKTDEEIKINEDRLAQIERLTDQENLINQARLSLSGVVVSGIRGLLAEEIGERKKFGGILKGLAIGEILINLQKQLLNISASTSSPLAVQNLLTAGIFGQAQGTLQKARAIAEAGFATATVLRQKFQQGGIVQGPSHAGGGVDGVVRSTGQPINFEGQEYIFSKNAVNRIGVPALNAMNFGGMIPRFFQEGGSLANLPLPSFVNQGFTPESVPRSISMDVEKMEAAFSRALVNMKPQVLSLTQLETAQNTMAEINDGATI